MDGSDGIESASCESESSRVFSPTFSLSPFFSFDNLN